MRPAWWPTGTPPMDTLSANGAKSQSSAAPGPSGTPPNSTCRVSSARNGAVSGITRPARVSSVPFRM